MLKEENRFRKNFTKNEEIGMKINQSNLPLAPLQIYKARRVIQGNKS